MVLEKVKERAADVRRTAREQMGVAIAAGFAFVMALAWNEAIQAFVESVLAYLQSKAPALLDVQLKGAGLLMKVVVALLTTLVCIFGIWYFTKLSKVKK